MMNKVVRRRSIALAQMKSEDLERWISYHGVNNAQKALQRAKALLKNRKIKKGGDRNKKIATARLNIFSGAIRHQIEGDFVWRIKACSRQVISTLEDLGCRVSYGSTETRTGDGQLELEVWLSIEMYRSTRHKDFRGVMEFLSKRGVPRASAIKALLVPRLLGGKLRTR